MSPVDADGNAVNSLVLNVQLGAAMERRNETGMLSMGDVIQVDALKNMLAPIVPSSPYREVFETGGSAELLHVPGWPPTRDVLHNGRGFVK
jgi:hypothetical protein